jgi:hypothetical protein
MKISRKTVEKCGAMYYNRSGELRPYQYMWGFTEKE